MAPRLLGGVGGVGGGGEGPPVAPGAEHGLGPEGVEGALGPAHRQQEGQDPVILLQGLGGYDCSNIPTKFGGQP